METIESILTSSEQTALARLQEKKSEVWRMSWPDLLERDSEGKIFFVEVKRLKDRLSKSQKESFVRLRELGFNVKIVRVEVNKITEHELKDDLKRRGSKSLKEKKRRRIKWVMKNGRGVKRYLLPKRGSKVRVEGRKAMSDVITKEVFDILRREGSVSLSETEATIPNDP